MTTRESPRAIDWGNAQLKVFQSRKAAVAYLESKGNTEWEDNTWAQNQAAVENGDYWSITATKVEQDQENAPP